MKLLKNFLAKGEMQMKERYETPKCDIIVFETEDIISTSTLGEGGNEESFPISIG